MEYTSKYKLIVRLVVSPIILALMLITYLMNTLRMFVYFIRYGGEWITYDNKDIVSIQTIYYQLKDKNNEK